MSGSSIEKKTRWFFHKWRVANTSVCWRLAKDIAVYSRPSSSSEDTSSWIYRFDISKMFPEATAEEQLLGKVFENIGHNSALSNNYSFNCAWSSVNSKWLVKNCGLLEQPIALSFRNTDLFHFICAEMSLKPHHWSLLSPRNPFQWLKFLLTNLATESGLNKSSLCGLDVVATGRKRPQCSAIVLRC